MAAKSDRDHTFRFNSLSLSESDFERVSRAWKKQKNENNTTTLFYHRRQNEEDDKEALRVVIQRPYLEQSA